MAVIGLLLGCGGDKGTETPKGDDKKGGGASGGQGSAHTKLTLAEFLPNKRIYVEVEMRDGEGEAEGEAE